MLKSVRLNCPDGTRHKLNTKEEKIETDREKLQR